VLGFRRGCLAALRFGTANDRAGCEDKGARVAFALTETVLSSGFRNWSLLGHPKLLFAFFVSALASALVANPLMAVPRLTAPLPVTLP